MASLAWASAAARRTHTSSARHGAHEADRGATPDPAGCREACTPRVGRDVPTASTRDDIPSRPNKGDAEPLDHATKCSRSHDSRVVDLSLRASTHPVRGVDTVDDQERSAW